MRSLPENSAQFRFYEELNDFLPPDRMKTSFAYRFNGNPAIKDPIEAIGVPHTEVDLILVNGNSVGFGHRLRDGDRVSVYPVFESLDISPIVKLREKPLRESAFVLDVHLGKLARRLRMLGFDTRYENNLDDPEIVALSLREKRIILTRDRYLLCARVVTHGYWIRSTDPEEQVVEVLNRFDLFGQIRPFHRCTVCNGLIRALEKSEIVDQLPPKTACYYDEFYRCGSCARVYWKGPHYQNMQVAIDRLLHHPGRMA